MRIDFGAIPAVTMPGMNGGTGDMTVRMVNDDRYRIVHTVIHPGGSTGIPAAFGAMSVAARIQLPISARLANTRTASTTTIRP